MLTVVIRIGLTVLLAYLAAFYGRWWLFLTLLLIALDNEFAVMERRR